ncbi:hypothetical protein HydSN_0685 [Hydrogenobaculum sp. SN]|nr:hypothetical protein Hyd3684_0669 [Hydrogenobaculum sp. 3684]AEG46354.1 hypothetical protein HydSHO_0670 [Hydrogenobaculum sp. SHO]AGG14997.1 hypothetical protein HydHO_0673 [Hydrogenobaculum sp. HO]AGH93294.1 hypothetical protein HydSN_0685 [Hydrogenobaculum sp. SN]
MIMWYNFFVGQVYHGLYVHDVVNLYSYLTDHQFRSIISINAKSI